MYGYEPAYSGKQMLSGDLTILFSKMSFLFRNRMMEVSLNHLLLQMESNSFRDSCMRFWRRDNSNNKLLKSSAECSQRFRNKNTAPPTNKQEMPAELKVVSREHMHTYKQYTALKQKGEMIKKMNWQNCSAEASSCQLTSHFLYSVC